MTWQLSDLERGDHRLARQTYNKVAQVAHTLSMIAHDADLSDGNRPYAYDTAAHTSLTNFF